MSSLHRHLSGNSGALGAGLTFALSVTLFAYGGLWLDNQFGTKPWCMLALVLCGIVGGTLHVIRVLAPELWPFGDLVSRSSDNSSSDNSKPPDTTVESALRDESSSDDESDVGKRSTASSSIGRPSDR